MTDSMAEKIRDILDWLINPLWLLHLRTSLRTLRFFLTFITCLALSVGTIIVGLLIISSGYNVSPDEIGQGLFVVFLFLEHTVIALFFPAFTCTSIIEEKEKKSFDLLINSDLKPSEISWGKFLSAFTHGFLFLASSLPLAMLCFLFGGVAPILIVLSYVLLLFIASLYIMLALWASAFYKTIVRAIIGAYIPIFIIAFMVTIAGGVFLEDYFHRSTMVKFFLGSWNLNHLFVIVMPLYVLTAFIVFSYLVTTNQLRPPHANCSTHLRLYCTIVLGILLFLGCTFFLYNYNPQIYLSSPGTRLMREEPYVFILMSCGFVTLLMYFAALGFGLESSVPGIHILGSMKKQRYGRWLSWLFYPGALSGAIYTSLLSLLFFSMAVATVYISTGGFNRKYFNYEREFETPLCFFFMPLVEWSFIFFISMFCAYLSLRFPSLGKLRTGIAIGVIVFLVGILPLYIPLALAIENQCKVALWDASYLSTFWCSVSSMVNLQRFFRDTRIDLRLFGILPIHYPFLGIYLISGILLLRSNIRMHQRALAEMYKKEEALAALQKK
jgi:hypothetical protein